MPARIRETGTAIAGNRFLAAHFEIAHAAVFDGALRAAVNDAPWFLAGVTPPCVGKNGERRCGGHEGEADALSHHSLHERLTS
jgi:hypothetical protein